MSEDYKVELFGSTASSQHEVKHIMDRQNEIWCDAIDDKSICFMDIKIQIHTESQRQHGTIYRTEIMDVDDDYRLYKKLVKCSKNNIKVLSIWPIYSIGEEYLALLKEKNE